jgi:hypothetical protein
VEVFPTCLAVAAQTCLAPSEEFFSPPHAHPMGEVAKPRKRDSVSADPQSTCFKVTVDVSSVVNTPESVLGFAKEVFRRLYTFAEAHQCTVSPPHSEDLATLTLEPPRLVQFLDTANGDLKKHAFLLRHREGLDGGDDLEDLTFKKRNDSVPTCDTLLQMAAAHDLECKTKVKMQWVSGKDAPAYGLYSQFKKKKLRALLQSNEWDVHKPFPISKLVGAFPVIESLGLPADAMISNNGLTILQQEVDLPPVTVDYGGHAMPFSPTVIVWFEHGTDHPGFTGEVTWNLDWSASFAQHHFQKELLFNRMVSHTLGGLVVAETKTAAAYHLMARWLLIGPVSIPTLLGSFYPPGICRGII